MNVCEDCGIRHSSFALECSHCQEELTSYEETATLHYKVSVSKGRLIMTPNDVQPYDDMDGNFYCPSCKNFTEADALREKIEQVTVEWLGAKEIIPETLYPRSHVT